MEILKSWTKDAQKVGTHKNYPKRITLKNDKLELMHFNVIGMTTYLLHRYHFYLKSVSVVRIFMQLWRRLPGKILVQNSQTDETDLRSMID